MERALASFAKPLSIDVFSLLNVFSVYALCGVGVRYGQDEEGAPLTFWKYVGMCTNSACYLLFCMLSLVHPYSNIFYLPSNVRNAPCLSRLPWMNVPAQAAALGAPASV